MRGYVEALEARAKGLPLNEVEQRILIRTNEERVADAELDLIRLEDK